MSKSSGSIGAASRLESKSLPKSTVRPATSCPIGSLRCEERLQTTFEPGHGEDRRSGPYANAKSVDVSDVLERTKGNYSYLTLLDIRCDLGVDYAASDSAVQIEGLPTRTVSLTA